MKNVILISTLGASVASSAFGAIAFNTVSSANWQTQGNGIYTSPAPTYYTDTLHNIAQSGANVTGGHGWGVFTATPNANSAAVADTIAPNMIVVTGSSSPTGVTFAFSQSTGAAPNTGLFGVAFNFNVTTSFVLTVTAVNGGSNSTTFTASATPLFVGIWESNFDAIQSVTFSLAGIGTMEFTSIEYGLVPAPGALALVGAAGLVGSRRRRA